MLKNFVLFIGQKILGGSIGAPLVIGANSLLQSGQSITTVVKVAGTITTTSTTDVAMTGMTITPIAGTYHVHFCTSITGTANNANIFYSVYAGGVKDAASEQQGRPTVQGGVTPTLVGVLPASAIAEVTVNGAQAIEVRWNTSAGTATAGNRYMTITRIR